MTRHKWRQSNSLKTYLSTVRPGNIADVHELERIVAAHWDELSSNGDGGMESYKLLNRMESVTWKPSILSFTIERHGGTALGSTRAELQHWEIDVERETATMASTGNRQLAPMASRLPIKSIAVELSRAIIDGKEDDRVRRQGDELVVLASDIFPKGSGFNRTVESRRQGLCKHVANMIEEYGWSKVGWNRFRKEGSA